ncbi:MAG: hypothetical protein ABIY55_36120 [Kofleriaceae bacterium]
MKTNHAVIDATGVYIGVNFAQHYGKRIRVLEVERFDEAESEIGPFTLPALVIRDECTLTRFGGLAATDRLAVGLLNADGQWTHGVRYRVPARDVDLTQLPANWEEMYRHIAHQHLSTGMLDTTGLAEALGAAYLAGARARSRGLV